MFSSWGGGGGGGLGGGVGVSDELYFNFDARLAGAYLVEVEGCEEGLPTSITSD